MTPVGRGQGRSIHDVNGQDPPRHRRHRHDHLHLRHSRRRYRVARCRHREAHAAAIVNTVRDASVDHAEFATKADLDRGIGALRSEMRWMFGFQAALILAIAAKLFGIV